jgi:hypothetical protein
LTNTSWEQLINDGMYGQENAGSVLSNSTALTDITGGGNTPGQALLIPASYFVPGQQFSIRARGIASTTGTPNLTLGIYLGGVAGVALAASTFATSANMANQTWSISADVRIMTTGTGGSVQTLGSISGLSTALAMLPATSASGGSAGVNTGQANILTVGAQWGAASTSNSIQLFQFLVEQMN